MLIRPIPSYLADLDPELHGLPLGIPAGGLGEDGWETVPVAVSCSAVSDEENAPGGGPSEIVNRKSARPPSEADEVIE